MASLLLDHITKKFPGVRALDNVSIAFHDGEIHALCGENGAGKSTLMNILAGNLEPDEGHILLDDKPVVLKRPQAAFDHGIAIVYQHLSLVDNLSVAENIYANQHPTGRAGLIRFEALYAKTSALLGRLKLEKINPRVLVGQLSPAHRQMVEIAKALSKHPSVFILDEPTASLTDVETRVLFEILVEQRNKGVNIIYISHRLEEIFLLSNRVSILKDGQYQGTFLTSELSKGALIKKMVGRTLESEKSKSSATKEILLQVSHISGQKFDDVSFNLHRGEIVGLAGLVGAGRTEIARAIFGADPLSGGEMMLRQQPFRAHHPSEAVKRGIAYLTEERKVAGLFQEMSIQDNIIAASLNRILPSGIYRSANVREQAATAFRQLNIRAKHLAQPVVSLSGGNQQMVMLAKWLLTQPDVLMIDEPTHGIDVGAKYEIYNILKSLAAEGKGVLMISSELPELIGLCDRIIVISKGAVSGVVSGEDMTEEHILELATG